MNGNGEQVLIDWLANSLPQGAEVVVGPGDDAAVVGNALNPWLVACDTLNDQVHFDSLTTTPELIGRKALAVNLSDMAAMGGVGRFALVGLTLNRGCGQDYARRIFAGMQALATQHGVSLVGGDTTSWDSPLSLTVAIMGVPHPRGPILRSGGSPGDVLVVTGPLGGSLSSSRHLYFQPRLQLIQDILDRYPVNALMDISDGLASDLPRLACASGCGFDLHTSQVPIHQDVQAGSAEQRLQQALADGEDFELLLALDPAVWAQLQVDPIIPGSALTRLGELTANSAQQCIDDQGRVTPFLGRGYEHVF